MRSVSGGRAALRLVGALASGVCLGLSFQPYNAWPLLALALPAFTLAVRGARPRQAFGFGYGFGLAMLLVAISWVHVLGWWVAIALIAFESVFFGLLGLIVSLTARLRMWPVAGACAWVLVEFSYSRVPFGGFGWTRIAYAAVDTPLAGFFPVIGVAGVSFLLALIGQLIAWLVVQVRNHLRRRGASPSRPSRLLLAPALTVAILLSGFGLRGYQVEPAAGRAGSVQVGIVQGNVPGRGLEALGRARSVTNNHLSETIRLTTRARVGLVPQPDFILWPENSTDIDPLLDPVTRGVVQAAAEVSGVPILVGAVTAGPGPDERQTTALWWDAQRGVLDRYAKRNLVPFGEWIPFRQQLLPVIPLLAQVGAQSIPGTTPGVLTATIGSEALRVGDVICFELAYDATVYETMTAGAELLVVQSNNATYGGTGQIEQQFAITRARAMETRREIAVATTNSVSGFLDRNGRVVSRTAEFTAASMVDDMPVRTALTPAISVAPWVDRGIALLGLVFAVAGIVALRRLGSRGGGAVREDESVAARRHRRSFDDTSRDEATPTEQPAPAETTKGDVSERS
ncbi:MAG TPA: apolipoprotein N-acyltransferase [Propionibacteriaceae bacterium]|nr:apolipoprotein N-acyltransferase [Propionibacteriaceae bacterium]